MARYTCSRCGATAHTTDADGHLCADIAARLKRAERQVQAVLSVAPGLDRDTAEAIVQRLNRLGIDNLD